MNKALTNPRAYEVFREIGYGFAIGQPYGPNNRATNQEVENRRRAQERKYK
jgi:hypothetical protein